MKLKQLAWSYTWPLQHYIILSYILSYLFMFIFVPNGHLYLYSSEPSLLHQIRSFLIRPSWGHLRTGDCQRWARNAKQKQKLQFTTGWQQHSRNPTLFPPPVISPTSNLFFSRLTSVVPFKKRSNVDCCFVNRNICRQVSTNSSLGLDIQNFYSIKLSPVTSIPALNLAA